MDENDAQESHMNFYAQFNSLKQGLLEPGQTTGSKNFKTPFF